MLRLKKKHLENRIDQYLAKVYILSSIYLNL